jgi:hypothetical protein
MIVGSLFTSRAQRVLSLLRNLIDEAPCSPTTRDFLLLAFTSSLAQSSRLHSIDLRPGREYRSRGWTLPSYWIASGHFEQNVKLSYFERCEKVRRGKKDANSFLAGKPTRQANTAARHLGSADFLLEIGSASDVLDIVKPNSVDYVFSDPPYGDSITYLELSEVWNVWLGKPRVSAYDQEVVISDAEGRGKTLDRYRAELGQCFEAIHRATKPGAWMSLTFHNRNIAVWNALLNAAVDAHFDFVNDVYQLPAAVSAKSGLQPQGSMTGDIVLNFRKPIGVPSRLRAGEIDVEKLIVDEARQIIAERRGRASEDQLMRGVVHTLLRHGVVDQSPDDVRTVLGRHLTRGPEGAWQLSEDTDPETLLDFVPLEKRIAWLIESVMAQGPVLFDEVLRQVFTNLKNGRTPQNQEISEVLQRVAIRMADGRWRLRTREDGAIQLALGEMSSEDEQSRPGEDEHTTHDQFVRMVAQCANWAGDGAWIGRAEQRHSRRLRELSLPNLSIPGLDADAIRQNRIDQIDVVWLRKGKVPLALFEIEHSTRAMTCIPRMGNLTRLLPHLALNVFIVAADGLEDHVRRQMASPSGQAILRDHPSRWYFLPYTKVLQLWGSYREAKGRPRVGDFADESKALDVPP